MTPRDYGLGFLLSSVVAVLIVIIIIWVGEYTKTRGRFLLTALTVEGYFFCSLAPVWAAERRPESRVAQVAIGAAVAAMLLLLIGYWGTPNSDAFWKSTAIVTILALVLAYLAVVDVEEGRLSRSLHAKAIGLATIIACLGIAGGINWPPYWWVFTLAVIGWLVTVAILVFSYLARRIQRR
ncbi:MAG: hypothetical protein H8E48_09895 [Chloroflexi bacterium]|nr:hypothetical protein [Chloroflexota bacterium]